MHSSYAIYEALCAKLFTPTQVLILEDIVLGVYKLLAWYFAYFIKNGPNIIPKLTFGHF